MLNSNKKYQDLKGRSVSCTMKRAEKAHFGEARMWYHFASKSSMKRFLKNEFSAVGVYACYINWVK